MKIKTKYAKTFSSQALALCVAVGTLAAFPGQASADTYHVVVPAPGKAAPYAAIKLELNPASLPAGIVGESFAGFDFNTALRITGDTELDMNQVEWSLYSGVTPSGLSLYQDGNLNGTPTDIGESSFQVRAKYKTKAAVGTYLVGINDITLELNATLPQAHPLRAFQYSLAAHLAVDGDPNYTPGAVTWALVEGTLPAGLNLTAAGEISGIPTVDGEYPLSVQATYKGRSVLQALQLDVVWTEIAVQETDGTRYWEDGTYAKSCQDYIRPPAHSYVYAGETGDGVYRIKPSASLVAFDVRCDMETDGGGWTVVDYAQDLPFQNWWSNGDQYRFVPEDFTLKLSDSQVDAIRAVSSTATQQYVGLCNGVVHYFDAKNSKNHSFAVGFRYHTGAETNYGGATYSPAKMNVIQDGCATNDLMEQGQVSKATIFDIENLNLPLINIRTRDSGHSNESFGSPLTQYPARFR